MLIFFRRTCETTYHPSCTCKMGSTEGTGSVIILLNHLGKAYVTVYDRDAVKSPYSDSMAVVDSDARLIGLENLRVVDASIMPSIVSGTRCGQEILIDPLTN